MDAGRARRVKVHLWGELGFYGPGREARFEVPLEHGMPILDALRLIGVPPAEVAVAGLNGEVVRLEDPSLTVTDGDRLDLFPPSSGGCDRARPVGSDRRGRLAALSASGHGGWATLVPE
jgi:sulfur carrier protein ThiS